MAGGGGLQEAGCLGEYSREGVTVGLQQKFASSCTVFDRMKCPLSGDLSAEILLKLPHNPRHVPHQNHSQP